MRATLWLIGVLGGAAPILADNPPPTYEETVVVTASADAEARQEVSASAVVLDAADIDRQQAASLGELLNGVAGVQMVSSGPLGQVSSAFVRGAESDQVLLLWNGVPLNNPDFGAINWAFQSTDGVERVEVVKGPFSSLYGGNAVGGVVQVLSGGRDGASLSLEGGENSYGRAGLEAGYDFGAVRLDVTAGLRRGDSEFENGFFDSDQAVIRADWRLGDGTHLGLLTRIQDSETGIPFSGGQPARDRRINWEERLVAMPFEAELGDWNVSALLSQSWTESAFRAPADAFGFTRSDSDSEAQRARAVVAYRGADAWRLAFGTEVERLESTNSSSFGTSLDGARQRTWSAFGEVAYEAGPVQIDLGLRRDDNDAFGAETSLRAGAVWRVADGTRLRASFGQAFRPPTLGDLFFPGSGNPNLQPERSESWEIGFEQRVGAWSWSLVGFDTEQEDLIDFDFATFRSVNVGRAQSRGAELGLGFEIARFAARLEAAYLDAEDLDSGLPLLRRAERTANLTLTGRPGDWILNLEGRYVGERPDVDPQTFARTGNPSYLRLDLAARWQVSPRFAPYARLENATDEAYQEALGFPAEGARLIGGVALRL